MFSLPRDTANVPLPAGPAAAVLGRDLRPEDQRALRRRTATAPTCARARRASAATTPSRRPSASSTGSTSSTSSRSTSTASRRSSTRSAASPSTSRSRSSTTTTRRRGGVDRRLYIPSGLQHMNGAEALRYARSRHTHERLRPGARQQRVLLSLREQADPQELIPRLPELVEALKNVGQDRHPGRPARRAARARVVRSTREHPLVRLPAAALRQRDAAAAPPVYMMFPNVERIRQAVKNAFKRDPADEAQRRGARRGGRRVWVLNGSSDRDRGPRPRRLPRVPRPRGVGAAPEARRAPSRPTTRSSSTTAPRRELAGHDRVPREDVQDHGRAGDRPGDPDGHHRHDRAEHARTSRRRRSS